MPNGPRHGRIEGAIVMIGFGSIGRGTLPLIERHFDYDKQHFVVIDPDDSDRKLLDERGIKFVHLAITRDNYREVLGTFLQAGGAKGFCVNLSVDTSSLGRAGEFLGAPGFRFLHLASRMRPTRARRGNPSYKDCSHVWLQGRRRRRHRQCRP